MALKQGEFVCIQAYKHNGHLHRNWDTSYVLETNDDGIVLMTNKTWVIDEDSKRWHTREPALVYLYPNKWFNVIAMIRESGIYYYCNFASPYVYDEEGVKYIDYDLDYKIFPDGEVVLMDEDEFDQHKKEMKYPDEITKISKWFLKEVKEMYEKKQGPFDKKMNEKHFQEYLDLLMK